MFMRAGQFDAALALDDDAAPTIAVLLPCYNEGLAIRTVVERFRAALPTAKIYVYDNNSSDGSADIARAAGAVVRSEPRQGKGFVVRRMFADIDADIYVMCDADETYDAAVAGDLVDRLVEHGLDMIVGTRVDVSGTAYRPAHRFGNWMLTSLVRTMFGGGFSDMLSGYRIFPAASSNPSPDVAGVRDRNRADDPRPATRHADRRNADALQGSPERIGERCAPFPTVCASCGRSEHCSSRKGRSCCLASHVWASPPCRCCSATRSLRSI